MNKKENEKNEDEVENECISHKPIVCGISVPKKLLKLVDI